jgi:hypothetical protein
VYYWTDEMLGEGKKDETACVWRRSRRHAPRLELMQGLLGSMSAGAKC